VLTDPFEDLHAFAVVHRESAYHIRFLFAMRVGQSSPRL
jgi:hypothetical protein